MWFLDFNFDGDKVEEVDVFDKLLKMVNVEWVVLLYVELVCFGLFEYVVRLRWVGYICLFLELKCDFVKGYGKLVGLWFNECFLGKKFGIKCNGMKMFYLFWYMFVIVFEWFDLLECVLV